MGPPLAIVVALNPIAEATRTTVTVRTFWPEITSALLRIYMRLGRITERLLGYAATVRLYGLVQNSIAAAFSFPM